MNIIILMSDQHRQDTAGCYGHPVVQTPHIDALAQRGLRFDNGFCNSPLCGPSRGSFLTGTHPHTHGSVSHTNNRHRSGKKYLPQIEPGISSLIAPLRDGGYQTHASGYTGTHFFEGEKNLDEDMDFLGFTSAGARDYKAMVGEKIARRYHKANIHSEMWEPSYFNVEGEPFPYDEAKMWDRLIADDASRFLRERNSNKPFFLYAGFRAPHPPWCTSTRFHDLYDPNHIGPLPDYKVRHRDKPRRVMERFDYFDIQYYPEQMVRNSIAAYYASVSYMDDCVGQILNELDAQGLREDTLVIYTSDHGENLYRHGLCEKQTFFDDAVRVPLIMAGTEYVPKGEQTQALAQTHDLLPTTLSLAGFEIPSFVEGRNLQPTFAGQEVRDHVFAEHYHSLDTSRMIRDHRYKYIHTEDDIDELYDMQNDPMELTNLAMYPAYRDKVEQMESQVLKDWEIPDVPDWATWRDLSERKQKQRLAGLDIIDTRTKPPDFVTEAK